MQGDGEVGLTVMEGSLRATVRLDVIAREEAARRFGELAGPLAETTEHQIPTGMDEDLDRAVQDRLRAAIALVRARCGRGPRPAYAHQSAAVDVPGVHVTIRKADVA